VVDNPHAKSLEDAQETRLDALRTEIARTETELEKVRGELGGLISSISFDLTTR